MKYRLIRCYFSGLSFKSLSPATDAFIFTAAGPSLHRDVAWSGCVSEESDLLEIGLDDDVGDGVKHKPDVVRICGTREVRVDLLLAVLSFAERLELQLDVRGRLLERVATWNWALVALGSLIEQSWLVKKKFHQKIIFNDLFWTNQLFVNCNW